MTHAAHTPEFDHSIINSLTDDQQRLLIQIINTFRFMSIDTPGALRHWLSWQCEELVPRTSTDDYTEDELMLQVCLSGRIFARILPGPGPVAEIRPPLKAVG